MKVDTKKMTPMKKVAPDTLKDSPDSCLFHENKYIEDGASSLKKENHNEEQEGGFWIRFIPTIFYTPVKCSKRNSADARTLDAKGVEDLNAAFSKLLISDKTDNDKEEETKEEKEETKDDGETSQEGKSVEREAADDNEEKLGRFKTTAKSVKTSRKVEVMRSYRLVEEEKE